MKTRTIIEELSQEDLVNLFSTATYGSLWLGIRTGETTGVEKSDNDCQEDTWAKAVLAGHKLKVTDYQAEGEKYGNLGCVIKKDGTAVYFVGLEEIKKGLARCADGDFKEDCSGTISYVRECFNHFADKDSMQMDQPEAEALMQVIMFGELIYG